MNIVDSSGWLEYLADGPNADFFASAVEDAEHLVVPTISLVEVFKKVLQQRGVTEALQVVSLMMKGKTVDLSGELAIEAASIGYELKLPLADSVMMATAKKFDAILWTQDGDFMNLEGVRYISKIPPPKP